MKKFIKGAFELDKDVTDIEAYEKKKESYLKYICDWGDKLGIAIQFGTTEDNKYLCEYRITAKTKAMCNGIAKELKEMLKQIFPCTKMCWQASGDCW